MAASALRKHDLEFQETTASGTWSWVTRMDLTGSRPVFTVLNIYTPWGPLRDSYPLPGSVVTAMADSISELQSQFPPKILVGPPSSFTFTLDEGRGESSPTDVSVTNNGVYGSLLGVDIVATQPWLRASTALLGNLAFNESGTFQIYADSTDLLASGSPFSGAITLTDADATNSPQSIPITVTVRPKATIDLSILLLEFSAVKPLSGAFSPVPSQTFVIENTGPAGSVLGYQVQKLGNLSDWLSSYSPVSGSLNSGSTQTITVTVAPPDDTLAGVYEETLRVSGYSTNVYQDILIRLTIT